MINSDDIARRLPPLQSDGMDAAAELELRLLAEAAMPPWQRTRPVEGSAPTPITVAEYALAILGPTGAAARDDTPGPRRHPGALEAFMRTILPVEAACRRTQEVAWVQHEEANAASWSAVEAGTRNWQTHEQALADLTAQFEQTYAAEERTLALAEARAFLDAYAAQEETP